MIGVTFEVVDEDAIQVTTQITFEVIAEVVIQVLKEIN
jgi:hypothetical protein